MDNFYAMVKRLKEYGGIPRNFSMTPTVIKTYFGSMENLQKEMQNGQIIKDKS